MNKKIIFACLVCFFCLFFTSCFDIVQSIDYVNGNYKINYRFTVNKLILAMADTDFSEIFNEADLSDLPEGVFISPIDSSIDAGFSFEAIIDPKSDSEDTKLLPRVLENGIICIPLIGEDQVMDQTDVDDSEAAALATALLSSAKWHVYITKKLVPNISRVYLTDGTDVLDVEYFEVGDVYVMNFPIIIIKSNMSLCIQK